MLHNRMQLHMRIFVVTLDVYSLYTVSSSSTVVQDLHNHHTALGWIACKRAEGFAQECFIYVCMSMSMYIHVYTMYVYGDHVHVKVK